MDISILNRDNFSAYDFFHSGTAIKNSILNIPKPYYVDKAIDALTIVANKTQEIRDLLGKPLYINSGFRCLELNRILGSKDTSQHPKGEAIDFVCPKFGEPRDIVLFLKDKKIEVDQCLVEKTWVHLSIKATNNRNESAYYIDGKFTLID